VAGALAAVTQACQKQASVLMAADLRIAGNMTVSVADPLSLPMSNSSTLPRQTITLTARQPVALWTWGTTGGESRTVRFVLVPVPVCIAPVGTVGLGDAISASALASDTLSQGAASAK
jgi:ADP-dependent phosphofructokinase/glucokinase